MRSGIDFSNDLMPTEQLNIITYLYYYNGGGIAAGDVNGDGFIDLYFTANQGSDALYINEGNLQFRETTATSGLSIAPDWSSGASFVDIDSDGDLDLYVNKVCGVASLVGRNELYINDGSGKFCEDAAHYGLDFSGLATQTAFSDFDGDGDLDAYLLAHSIHSTERRIDTSMRSVSSSLSGDRLYLQNENGIFENSTSNSGIFQSRIGYGLGLAVADFTDDCFSDIYVSNDFSENDYFYINQRNGRFVESIGGAFPFSSKFSMGNVAADINSDGKLDLFTLDMRPSSDSIRKSSAGDSSPREFERQRKFGFLDQQVRNVLHLSCGNRYIESAILLGIHSTDWSWAPIVADFDLDGHQDIFIANGIWQRPNDLDYLKFTSAKAIQRKATNLQLASLMPSGLVPNHLYLGSDEIFPLSNVAPILGLGGIGSTTSALAVDLDNDGDLDLVTNNVNAPAKIFENSVTKSDTSQVVVNIKLKGSPSNPFAIGAKIKIESDSRWERLIIVQPVTGFQSSNISNNLVALPAGVENARITVTWPDGLISQRKITSKGSITFEYDESSTLERIKTDSFLVFKNSIDSSESLSFFTDNPLYPVFYLSDSVQFDSSRNFATGAVKALFLNGELRLRDTTIKNVRSVKQLSDGRSKNSASHYVDTLRLDSLQTLRLLVAQKDIDGSFRLSIVACNLSSKVIFESHPFLDRKFNDISSIDRMGNTWLIQPSPRSYDSTIFLLQEFLSPPILDSNASEAIDFRYKLRTQSLSFLPTQVTDIFRDKDTAYISRLWAPVEKRWFDASSGLIRQEFIGQYGLWTSISSYNDSLLLFKNVGYNNLLVENPDQQLELHLADYDRNGEIDPIAVRLDNGQRYTMFGLDEIAEQMPTLRKFFTSYLPFSSSTFDEMFPPQMSKGVTILKAESLASVFYNRKSGLISDVPLKLSHCLASSNVSGEGRIHIHPSLRGNEK